MATPIPPNRAAFDARTAAEATGGRLFGPTHARTAVGVTTDSRAVTPGCAFVALRGAVHDGHEYLAAAVVAGAVLLVVERGRAVAAGPETAVIEVDDTLAAWGALARRHLLDWRAAGPDHRTVAVTGSAGKTTTKEICAALLRSVAPCQATTGNLNNRVGLPAVALGVEAVHRFVVLEMGMSVPGEIAALAHIAEPDVGIITNVGLAHAGGVGGRLEDVAREKGALFAGMAPGGLAVVNRDDLAVVGQEWRAARAEATGFGLGADAEYRLESRESRGVEGSRLTVRRPTGARSVFTLPLPGAAAAIDFVAALAAAEGALDGPLDDRRVAEVLAGLSPIDGRMQVRRLAGPVVVLDDSYNASPATVRAALVTLAEVASGRRVAVLGEMKELGPSAAREHEAVGEAAAEAGVALLVSCGGLADEAARAAARRGVAVRCAQGSAEAARLAVDEVRPGDTVLVKASRSVAAERVVEALVQARPGDPN